MWPQILNKSEWMVALNTGVRLLSSVNQHVYLQIRGKQKWFVALCTNLWLLSSVIVLVLGIFSATGKRLDTQCANVFTDHVIFETVLLNLLTVTKESVTLGLTWHVHFHFYFLCISITLDYNATLYSCTLQWSECVFNLSGSSAIFLNLLRLWTLQAWENT